MKDIYITWEIYNNKIEQLAKKVHEDNLKFNQIICIAKGGLRVGDVFSRLFNVPLAILSVESYHGDSDDIKNQQGQFTFSRDLAKTTPNLGSHVLLVDDLAVTSESLGVQDIEQALMNYFYDDVTKAVTINSSNAPLSELIVYNMLGQVVSEKTTTKSSETIDMSTFDKGVYIIKAFSELGTKTMRVINY